MPTGASVGYVSGTTHVPLPMAGAGYRPHTPAPARKPSGLDWDALRPHCSACDAPSGELRDSLCPRCTPAPVVATSTPVTTDPTSSPAPASLPGSRRGPHRQVKDPNRVDGRSAHIDKDLIIRLYTEGMTVPKIQATLGHVQSTIRRVLTTAGVEIRDDRKSPSPRRRPSRASGEPRKPRCDRIVLDTPTVVAAYQAGQTLAQIAATHGCSTPTVARHLEDAGVPRRATATHVTPELVAQVRSLYVDEHRTQAEVAAHLGLTVKIIQNIMGSHHIQPRPAAHLGGQPGVDRAIGLKTQIQDLGVSPRQIKEWALRAGLIHEIAVGLPPVRLVTAYADAHNQQVAS